MADLTSINLHSAETKSEAGDNTPSAAVSSRARQAIPMVDSSCESNEVSGWADANAERIRAALNEEGAILIRGVKIQGSKKLEKTLEVLFGEALSEYTYRSTPRTKLRGRVYTSTEYPASEVIPLHNENAYANRWPTRIAFYCVQAAQEGGATPIANSHDVYRDIPKDIKEEFEAKRLRYVRNYSTVDLPWTEVFQTDSKAVVNQFCQANGIEYSWLNESVLRTEQVNDSALDHPTLGKRLWFNQAHLFHISSQAPEVAASLLDEFGRDHLPRNVYFADGSDIPCEMIQTILATYERHATVFPWQENDLLLLDNMLYAHGRQAYAGKRRVLTATALPLSADDNNTNL